MSAGVNKRRLSRADRSEAPPEVSAERIEPPALHDREKPVVPAPHVRMSTGSRFVANAPPRRATTPPSLRSLAMRRLPAELPPPHNQAAGQTVTSQSHKVLGASRPCLYRPRSRPSPWRWARDVAKRYPSLPEKRASALARFAYPATEPSALTASALPRISASDRFIGGRWEAVVCFFAGRQSRAIHARCVSASIASPAKTLPSAETE